MDDASFEEACARAGPVDQVHFLVPLDAHRVGGRDTRNNRKQIRARTMETVYLAGLSDDELNEV